MDKELITVDELADVIRGDTLHPVAHGFTPEDIAQHLLTHPATGGFFTSFGPTTPAIRAAQPSDALPTRVLAMCKKRDWSLHWTSRGAYLHLEASELIEALRGKRGEALSEAADVLLVLMSITESAGIPWGDVLDQTAATCARLEMCGSYPGEERDAQLAPPAAPAPPPLPPDYIDPEHHGDARELLEVFYRACNAEGGTADEIHLRGIRAVLATCPTAPRVPEVGEVGEVVAWLQSMRELAAALLQQISAPAPAVALCERPPTVEAGDLDRLEHGLAAAFLATMDHLLPLPSFEIGQGMTAKEWCDANRVTLDARRKLIDIAAELEASNA